MLLMLMLVLQALVASLRDELISDASIRQQQEVEMIIMTTIMVMVMMMIIVTIIIKRPLKVLVASLCPASSDPAECLESLPGLWR